MALSSEEYQRIKERLEWIKDYLNDRKDNREGYLERFLSEFGIVKNLEYDQKGGDPYVCLQSDFEDLARDIREKSSVEQREVLIELFNAFIQAMLNRQKFIEDNVLPHAASNDPVRKGFQLFQLGCINLQAVNDSLRSAHRDNRLAQLSLSIKEPQTQSQSLNQKKSSSKFHVSMTVLSAFCLVAGIAMVALAFTVLNMTVLGIVGISAAILGGIGLFVTQASKHKKAEIPESNASLKASI